MYAFGKDGSSPEGGEAEVLRLAAAVEAGTRHPLAEAVIREAEARGVEVPLAMDTRTEPGFGEGGEV